MATSDSAGAKRHLVGQTQHTGFHIGVRRTLPIPCDAAWALLTSPQGLQIWLGALPAMPFVAGATYRLADGTHGEIRLVHHRNRARLSWHPVGWARPSTIQIRVIPRDQRATIAFHQEQLPGPLEREQRRRHFAAALDALEQHSATQHPTATGMAKEQQ